MPKELKCAAKTLQDDMQPTTNIQRTSIESTRFVLPQELDAYDPEKLPEKLPVRVGNLAASVPAPGDINIIQSIVKKNSNPRVLNQHVMHGGQGCSRQQT